MSFCVSFIQEKPWGKHADDAKRTAMGPCCFICTDGVGRIRPGLPIEEAVRMFKMQLGRVSREQMDTEQFKCLLLQTELKAALLILNGKKEAPTFMPSCSCQRRSAYRLEVFEEMAALTETEYTHIMGASPQFFSKQNAFTTLPLNGPGSAVKVWVVNLDGLSSAERDSVRRLRVTYLDEVSKDDLFLRPDDQLLSNQGTAMFAYVSKTQSDQRPDGAKAVVTSVSDSVRKLRQIHEDYISSRQVAAEASAPGVFSVGTGEDQLLEGEAASDLPDPGRAGLDLTHLGEQQNQPPAKRRRAAKAAAKKAAEPQAVPASSATAAEDATMSMEDLASVTTHSKKGTTGLDPTMTLVAEKHLGSEGSSVKSLENFCPEAFLNAAASEDDRGLGAQLRGARALP